MMSSRRKRRRLMLAFALLFGGFGLTVAGAAAEQRAPAGRVVIAWHAAPSDSAFLDVASR